MELRDRTFYRPAVLWAATAGIAAFLAEYVAKDGTVGRALLWGILAALGVGLFVARLLGMRDGTQRRPRQYSEREVDTSSGESN